MRKSDLPIILVHPWMTGIDESHYPVLDLGESLFGREETLDYLYNLDLLLKRFQGDVFVFEEKRRIPSTSQRIQAHGERSSGIYLIPTRPVSSTPNILHSSVQKEWDNVAGLLAAHSGNFYFAGCSYSPFGGCLSTTYKELTSRGIQGRFVRGCCFGR